MTAVETAEPPTLAVGALRGVGDGDDAIEVLERAEQLGAVRPRAADRGIQVIARRLGLEAGRAVGGDEVAEPRRLEDYWNLSNELRFMPSTSLTSAMPGVW